MYVFQYNEISEVGIKMWNKASVQRPVGEPQWSDYRGAKGTKVIISTQLSCLLQHTPTFCGYTAFLDYCGEFKPHIPIGASMVGRFWGSPEAKGMLGMWHWKVWRGVRPCICSSSSMMFRWLNRDRYTNTHYLHFTLHHQGDRCVDIMLGGELFCYSGRKDGCGKVTIFLPIWWSCASCWKIRWWNSII